MLKRLLLSITLWWSRIRGAPVRRYRLSYVDGDELPAVLPEMTLVVAREGDVHWTSGMVCPCGCGRRLEMMLLQEVTPRWRLRVDDQGPSLTPSVWVADGCRSHFWLRNGLVRWCDN